MAGLILPAAEWREREGLAALLDALDAKHGATRYVGGAVRDTLLGRPVADVDLATQLTPDDVVARIRRAGMKPVPTGIAHGTVTAVLPGSHVEVTTLRRDVSTDGRRATVAFSDDWREDAARRDFTINALYADPASGAILDYFGGAEDLANGLVRFIGDARQRIAEDHLRILRFFRFHARYGTGAPEAQAYDACAERANDLMALSRERIADELLKLLASDDPAPAIALMLDRAILKPVLPEIDRAGLDQLDRLVAHEKRGGVSDALRRLIALMPGEPVGADAIAARLKLSNAQRKRIAAALGGCVDPAHLHELGYRIGRGGAIDRLLLSALPDAQIDAGLAALDGWQRPTLPIGGGALVERGLNAGPDVARALKEVEERWLAEDFPGAARVNALADEAVAQALARRNANAASESSGRAK